LESNFHCITANVGLRKRRVVTSLSGKQVAWAGKQSLGTNLMYGKD